MFARFQHRDKRGDDLPTSRGGLRPRNVSPLRRCRANRLVLCAVVCVVLFFVFLRPESGIPLSLPMTEEEVDPEITAYEEWIRQHPDERLPPTYEEYWAREAKMTRPHVPGTKYFFPARHIWGESRLLLLPDFPADVNCVIGLGWGNAVQELLVNALLAHESNRS